MSATDQPVSGHATASLAPAANAEHLRFLESLDRVHRAMYQTQGFEETLGAVMRVVLDIFACDRAWLVYPCDPDAPAWGAVMEHTRPEYPGLFAAKTQVVPDAATRDLASLALAGDVVMAGAGNGRDVPGVVAERFSIRSLMALAVRPKGDRPYLFGLHQCSRDRAWKPADQRLFQEIGRRLGDALTSLLMFRNMRESEQRLEAAQRLAHVGWWERDYRAQRVSLSGEAQRIFGAAPVELPAWRERWASLIHAEDRVRIDAASAAAMAGGPRYDVEYRIVRPDGEVRVVHSQGDVERDAAGNAVRQFGVMQDITELRAAERELRVSEARFRMFVDHATDALFLHDETLVVVDANRQACENLGYAREELVGMHPRDFDAGLQPRELEELAARVGAGETVNFETLHRRRDGTTFPVEIRAREFVQDGRRLRLALARDITERKRAERALRDSEERFRTLVRFSFDVYWETDESHRFVRQEFADGLQDAPQAGSELGKTRWEVPYVAPGEEGWREHRAMMDSHLPFRDFELARPTSDGGRRYVSVSGMPVFDESGRWRGYRGVGRHITERKHVEEALRASEARFRALFDHATDAIFLMDADSGVVDVNRQACENLGYTRDELLGMQPHDFDASLDAPAVARLMQRVAAGETVTFETLHRRKDGSTIPVEVRVREMMQGEQRLRLSIVRDIRERRRAEQRMLARHAVEQILSDADSVEEAVPRVLRALCESLDWDLATLWRVDAESGMLRCTDLWSKAASAVAFFEKASRGVLLARGEGLPGRAWADRAPAWFVDLTDAAVFLRAAAAAADGLRSAHAFPVLLGDEVLGVIELFARREREPDAELSDMMASLGRQVGQFVERRRAEEQLRVAQSNLAHVARLAAMGELTASIAHEVNQPLGAMVTSAASCARWLQADPPNLARAQAALERIVADGRRASAVIDRVRDLVKRQPLMPMPVDLGGIVREVVAMTAYEVKRSGVSLRLRLADDLPSVHGDRIQLQQVVLNLILNAVDAMRHVEDRPRLLTIVSAPDGAGVRVEVRDSGTGFDAEGAAHLFDAFYTTKESGLGMGLSISRSIVEAHGGRIAAQAEQPHGASFRFWLPLDGGAPAEAS